MIYLQMGITTAPCNFFSLFITTITSSDYSITANKKANTANQMPVMYKAIQHFFLLYITIR